MKIRNNEDYNEIGGNPRVPAGINKHSPASEIIVGPLNRIIREGYERGSFKAFFEV
jgi:hypothetical protein